MRHGRHTRTTAASETEGVSAGSWIESLMIRRPFGSVDPNSIRERASHSPDADTAAGRGSTVHLVSLQQQYSSSR